MERDFRRRLEMNDPPPLDYQHPGALDLVRGLYEVSGKEIQLDSPEAAKWTKDWGYWDGIVKGPEKERDEALAHLLSMVGDARKALLPGYRLSRWEVAETEMHYTRQAYIASRIYPPKEN
jgi:hypothetical protein